MINGLNKPTNPKAIGIVWVIRRGLYYTVILIGHIGLVILNVNKYSSKNMRICLNNIMFLTCLISIWWKNGGKRLGGKSKIHSNTFGGKHLFTILGFLSNDSNQTQLVF